MTAESSTSASWAGVEGIQLTVWHIHCARPCGSLASTVRGDIVGRRRAGSGIAVTCLLSYVSVRFFSCSIASSDSNWKAKHEDATRQRRRSKGWGGSK